jgi:hypothetical protein
MGAAIQVEQLEGLGCGPKALNESMFMAANTLAEAAVYEQTSRLPDGTLTGLGYGVNPSPAEVTSYKTLIAAGRSPAEVRATIAANYADPTFDPSGIVIAAASLPKQSAGQVALDLFGKSLTALTAQQQAEVAKQQARIAEANAAAGGYAAPGGMSTGAKVGLAVGGILVLGLLGVLVSRR